MRSIVAMLALAVVLRGGDRDLKRATELYERTEYDRSLKLLAAIPNPDAGVFSLEGQNYLMMGDFKRATEAVERAVALQPNNAEYYLWLGRAWGRRAEVSNPFIAPAAASKARDAFERSVALDPTDLEAMSDLFDYYLEAPGFLGGGMDKAAALAQRMARIDPAEYQFAQARIAERRKEYNSAEEHFRRAVQLGPRQVGRFIALARYLNKQGRADESEAVFAQAERIAPNNPRLMYAHAEVYIQQHRHLDKARDLLKRYIESDLTPDDPPREAAERLLEKTVGA